MTNPNADALKLAKDDKKAACDLIVARAAQMMVADCGASIELMLDRMLTYAGAQSCTMFGSPETAATFRRLADNIDAGCFHPVTGEKGRRGGVH